MKTAWICATISSIGLIAAGGIGIHSGIKLQAVTAERDSIAMRHIDAMRSWEEVRVVLRAAQLKAKMAYFEGSRDFDVVFDAGANFGAFLERWTFETTLGQQHWDETLDGNTW